MHHRPVERQPTLTAEERRFVHGARRAVLATVDPERLPRLVPICHVVGDDDPLGRARLYTPLDEKPKRDPEPRSLARVRDLLAVPDVVVLVDRWDEDWARLGWVRVYGRAELIEPAAGGPGEHAAAVAALRVKYPPYRNHDLETRPLIRVTIHRARAWGFLA